MRVDGKAFIAIYLLCDKAVICARLQFNSPSPTHATWLYEKAIVFCGCSRPRARLYMIKTFTSKPLYWNITHLKSNT